MFKNLSPQLKMTLMMSLCALPMLGIVAIRIFDIAVSNVALVALAIACPVGHLLMMRMGMHGHSGAHVHVEEQDK